MDANDEIMSAILGWLARTGWPSEEDDLALAEACYETWLRETRVQWVSHGRRDRECLHSRLVAALTERHGDTDAAHIATLLMVHLESKARLDGDNFRGLAIH